ADERPPRAAEDAADLCVRGKRCAARHRQQARLPQSRRLLRVAASGSCGEIFGVSELARSAAAGDAAVDQDSLAGVDGLVDFAAPPPAGAGFSAESDFVVWLSVSDFDLAESPDLLSVVPLAPSFLA